MRDGTGLPEEALEFQPDALALETRPAPRRARWVLRAVCLFLVLAVAWAAWARVDRVVTAQGRLVTTAQPVVIQPTETARIRKLTVHIGDRVAKGAVVATLDPVAADADLADLDGRISSLDAEVERLIRERDGQDQAVPVTMDQKLQQVIHEQRMAEYRSHLDSYRQQEDKSRSALDNSLRALARQKERLTLLESIEGMRTELMQLNVGSRLQAMAAHNDYLTLRDDMAREADRQSELQHDLGNIAAERAAYIGEWNRKLAEALVEAYRQRQSLIEQKVKAQHRANLMELVAPVDAIVLDVAKRSENSVVRDAEPVVTLVPAAAPLEVEVDVEARDIGMIHPDDSVRVKLEAFPFQRHGTLPGYIRVISPDAVPREAAGAAAGQAATRAAPAVFKARVSLATETLERVPADTRLIPGMNATVEIHVGRRTVLSYLLYPVIRAFDESLSEP